MGSSATTTANLAIVTAGRPTSGTWMDSAKPAWSWDISRNSSGQLALVWYTFTASGNPTWYMSVLNPKHLVGGNYYGNVEWSSWFDGTLDGCTYNASLFRDVGVNACPACSGTQSTTSSQVGTIAISGINGSATTAVLSSSFFMGSNLTQWNRSNLAMTRLTN